MAKSKLILSVTSSGGKRQIKTEDGLSEEIVGTISRVTLPKLADKYDEALSAAFNVVAIFLQRLITRTPVDEDYSYVTSDGKEIKHKKDKDVARYDWYVTDGTKSIMSRKFFEEGCSFQDLDDETEIRIITRLLIETFGLKETVLTIGNANKHIDVLEYGGGFNWSKDSEIKNGNEREHGVRNEHSVQAPVGMFRLSIAELEEGIKSKSNMDEYKNKHSGYFTQKDIKKFADALLGKGSVKVNDIKRFIGKR